MEYLVGFLGGLFLSIESFHLDNYQGSWLDGQTHTPDLRKACLVKIAKQQIDRFYVFY